MRVRCWFRKNTYCYTFLRTHTSLSMLVHLRGNYLHVLHHALWTTCLASNPGASVRRCQGRCVESSLPPQKHLTRVFWKRLMSYVYNYKKNNPGATSANFVCSCHSSREDHCDAGPRLRQNLTAELPCRCCGGSTSGPGEVIVFVVRSA